MPVAAHGGHPRRDRFLSRWRRTLNRFTDDTMRSTHFIDEIEGDDPFDPPIMAVRTDWIEELRKGPWAGTPDAEVAPALARFIHDEFEKGGTDGSQLMDDEAMRLAMAALDATLGRMRVQWDSKPPFRTFKGFLSYWRREGAVGDGAWQARRDILDGFFEPLHEQLVEVETQALASSLADPISPRGVTGWSRVDELINEMRRDFEAARSEQAYANVGNDAVAALEAVSAAAYNHARDGEPGSDEPPVDKTKERLARVIETRLAGSASGDARRLARAAVNLAQTVKHGRAATRRDAGIAADSVILVTNLIRRVVEP